VILAAALAARAPTWGHVCLDLDRPVLSSSGESLTEDVSFSWPTSSWPGGAAWAEALAASDMVGGGADGESLPFVLRDGRLYLARYWRYQARIEAELVHRLAAPPDVVDSKRLKAGLERLFPGRAGLPSPDLQKVAAQLAVQRRLAVISGGPGTGKTTTVVKILALLQEQAEGTARFPLRRALLAPTGKAAARLSESIKLQKTGLDVSDAVRAALPEEASTIHRQLGYQPRSPTRFRHGEDNKLPVDVLVCDESSMVDLPLMAKLVMAVPRAARLILLGDRHQLTSVEAGSVLGDICDPAALKLGYSAAAAAEVKDIADETVPVAAAPAPALRDAIVELRHSFRFDDTSGIGGLAHAINLPDAERAVALLDAGAGGVEWIHATEATRVADVLGGRLREGFAGLSRAAHPLAAVKAFGRFGVLCAHRNGWRGVEAVNRLARAELVAASLVSSSGDWFHGRPIMVLANDNQIGLYNGDVGVTLADPEDATRFLVHFLGADGHSTRAFAPAQLPVHTTAYGFTIHKSQGSEFDEVIVSLPERSSPVLTRELLYTAVTRAKERVFVLGEKKILEEAIGRPVHRASGLRGLLWRTNP
jgi:exodeoxyribonuclease V alpha subunit